MLIYCVHSSAFDFVHEFYKPIELSSAFREHKFIFPHVPGSAPVHSKSVIEACDLVLAEVSYPSTGMGIEIGWADAAGKPIWAAHRNDVKISGGIKMVATETFSYHSMEDVLSCIPLTSTRLARPLC